MQEFGVLLAALYILVLTKGSWVCTMEAIQHIKWWFHLYSSMLIKHVK